MNLAESAALKDMENVTAAFARIRSTIRRERCACFLSRWLFLRLIGLIYLIAFVSLWSQIDGLVGHNGILPVADRLTAAGGQLGPERYWWLPLAAVPVEGQVRGGPTAERRRLVVEAHRADVPL